MANTAEAAGDRAADVAHRNTIDESDARGTIAIAPNVPRLGQAIQERISLAVERMLGMTVTELDVHVAEIAPGGGPKDDGSR
jgi:hypothetical protein